MAGILGYDPSSAYGGLLGANIPTAGQSQLGLWSSALQDAGAYISGHPADANNIAKYRQTMMQDQLRQAYMAVGSKDPAVRQQAYQTIMSLGGDPSALQKYQAAQAMPDLLKAMQTPQINPVQVTPQVTAPTPQGQTAPTMQDRVAAMGPNTSLPTLQQALSAPGVAPELPQELFPQLLQNQLEMQRKQVRPATDQEMQAAGYPKGSHGLIDAYGNISTDVKTQAAVDQAANAPISPYQKAVLAHENAAQSETARHNKAEEAISLNPLGLGIGDASNPQNAGLTGNAYLKTLPPAIQATVKAIGDGRMAPVSGFALARPQGMAIMAAVNKYNPDYDATTIQNRANARKAFVTGQDGKSVTAINTAVDHLDTLGQLATALGNGDVQTVNKLGQSISQEFGGSAPTNFDTARQVVGDEIVKALVGTGGSIADREEAKATINRASSPQQLAGAIQTYQKLLAGKLGPLRQKYQTNTKLQDFNDQLTPTTQSVLGSLPQGGSRSAPPPHPEDLPRVGASGGVARVQSDADYNKLPSGTVFVGPDGKQRRKP